MSLDRDKIAHSPFEVLSSAKIARRPRTFDAFVFGVCIGIGVILLSPINQQKQYSATQKALLFLSRSTFSTLLTIIASGLLMVFIYWICRFVAMFFQTLCLTNSTNNATDSTCDDPK